jgi:hypothetical protein
MAARDSGENGGVEFPPKKENGVTLGTIDESQRKAAKVVGVMYLFGFTAVFDEMYVRGRLIVANNASETTRNIVAHERLFRIGIAVDLLEMASMVVLITALYVVLKAVNPNLALLAVLWRMMEAVICVVMTLSSFDVLRVLSGAEYLRVFEPDRLQTLARIYVGAHGAGYNVAEIFLGLGSTVFSYLWFKSRYIPRILAAWGVFASLLVAICTFTSVVFPDFQDMSFPSGYVPIAIFELTMGFWLLLKGLPPSGVAESANVSDRTRAGAA